MGRPGVKKKRVVASRNFQSQADFRIDRDVHGRLGIVDAADGHGSFDQIGRQPEGAPVMTHGHGRDVRTGRIAGDGKAIGIGTVVGRMTVDPSDGRDRRVDGAVEGDGRTKVIIGHHGRHALRHQGLRDEGKVNLVLRAPVSAMEEDVHRRALLRAAPCPCRKNIERARRAIAERDVQGGPHLPARLLADPRTLDLTG